MIADRLLQVLTIRGSFQTRFGLTGHRKQLLALLYEPQEAGPGVQNAHIPAGTASPFLHA
jgi:hypothetical protein